MGVILLLLFAAFCALQAADAVTTVMVLNRNGTERNPIVRWLIERTGIITALLVIKAIVIACGWVMMQRSDTGWLAVVTIFYLLVVANNIRELRSA